LRRAKSSDNIRGHLETISKSAWGLANWLAHANGTTRPDAEFVLDATQNVIDIFRTAVMRHESQPRKQLLEQPRVGKRTTTAASLQA
jgi:hypothetical protein